MKKYLIYVGKPANYFGRHLDFYCYNHIDTLKPYISYATLTIWSIYDAMHLLTLAAHIATPAVAAQHTSMSSALHEPPCLREIYHSLISHSAKL